MTAALWALAVAALGFTLARLLGLERGFIPVVLIAYTPYAVGLAVVIVVICAWRQRWWAALVAGVATTGLAVAVVPRAVVDRPPRLAAGAPTLTVASANMKLGQGRPAGLVKLVRERSVDVLAVEELTPGLQRALDSAGMHSLLPSRILMPARAALGSGLYSRLPLSALEPVSAQIAGRQTPMAAVTVQPGVAVTVAVAHPTPPAGPSQMSQWQVGLGALPGASDRGPLRVIAGDFNATLDHADLRSLLATGYADAADATGTGLVPTWPAGLLPPPVTIDHVLVDRRAAVDGFEVDGIEGSDHKAVVARLRLPARK
jgi:endonuclease/exonuclease/phosphatase (EEP) superfamily protein YafD